ncbi:MAG: YHS domain-containing protein [Planctomycetota bacterium]|jgi:YHS domain-containing protein
MEESKMNTRLIVLPLLYLVLMISVAEAAGEKVFDPACGMKIDKDSAVTCEYQGETYYFCSEVCKENFKKAPEELACVCATEGMPGCKCAHCGETAAKCGCKLESGGHAGGGHHH